MPEFEIDAQPVTWAQYVEFVDDGGYDREELWHPRGWAWLEREARAEGRRGPRHVEQIGVASGAVHADASSAGPRAWARSQVRDARELVGGRRLGALGGAPPADRSRMGDRRACRRARRGFRWGDVREWTAGTLRPLAGFRQDAWAAQAELDAETMFGAARVLRGASFATRARMRHPRARAWALPDAMTGSWGFAPARCEPPGPAFFSAAGPTKAIAPSGSTPRRTATACSLARPRAHAASARRAAARRSAAIGGSSRASLRHTR